jgi:hypothetical protein
MARAFVIRPFGTKTDSSGRVLDFEVVHSTLIKPALEANGLVGDTTGEIVEAGNIREDMFQLILEADVVVCDITINSANVFYELGIRHALRKRTTVLIKGTPVADATPFDLLTDRYMAYDIASPERSCDELARSIRRSINDTRPSDSPIFQMLPALPEADPENVQVVPADFSEEVRRAEAARSKGWLRLIAEEVRGLRFQRPGTKIIGRAQWAAKDYDGARDTWERVLMFYPDDPAANLALANLYERLSRGHEVVLLQSDQAIERVLQSGTVSAGQRAEALALKGRNQKTHWRQRLVSASSVEERREAALSRELIDSYESYLRAFMHDLNHFYSGLGALQCGSLLFDLSHGEAWEDLFADARAAANYRVDLERRIADLSGSVPLAITAALDRTDLSRDDRLWARISQADVLFLTDQSDRRVVKAYEAAFERVSPFNWDASRRQLQLFADLGVKPARVHAVVAAVERRIGESPPSKMPTHVVVFAGHQVDASDRPRARFPPAMEQRARELIESTLQRLCDGTHHIVALASASPGADILWHESCEHVGVETTICLPMPVAEHARSVFANQDAWRARFLDLASAPGKVLTLSDREGLPRWLDSTGKHPCARGNEWLMKMAVTWGADKVTLVAFWDGDEAGIDAWGTSHLVHLARQEGTVRVERIDSTQLLA